MADKESKSQTHQDPPEEDSPSTESLTEENLSHEPERDANNTSQLVPILTSSEERDLGSEVNNLSILERENRPSTEDITNETPSTSSTVLDLASPSDSVISVSNTEKLQSLLHTNLPLRNPFTLPPIESWIEQLNTTQATSYETISLNIPKPEAKESCERKQSTIFSSSLKKQLGIDTSTETTLEGVRPEKKDTPPSEFVNNNEPSGSRGDIRLRVPPVVNTTAQLLRELSQVFTTTQTTANSESPITESGSALIIRSNSVSSRSFTSTTYSGIRPRMLFPDNFPSQRCVPYVASPVSKKYISKTEKTYINRAVQNKSEKETNENKSNNPPVSIAGLPELPTYISTIPHSAVEERQREVNESVEEDIEKWNIENLRMLAEVAGKYGDTVGRNIQTQYTNSDTPISRVLTTIREVASQSTTVSQPQSTDTSKGAIPKRNIQSTSSLPKIQSNQGTLPKTRKGKSKQTESTKVPENRPAQESLELPNIFPTVNRTPVTQIDSSRPTHHSSLNILASILQQRDVTGDSLVPTMNEEPSTSRGAIPKKQPTTTVPSRQGRVSLRDTIPRRIRHSTGTVTPTELSNIQTLPRFLLTTNIHQASTSTPITTSPLMRTSVVTGTETITSPRERVPLRDPNILFLESNIPDTTPTSRPHLQSQVSQGAVPKMKNLDSVSNTSVRRRNRRKKKIKGLQRQPSTTFTQNQIELDEESNTKSGSHSPPVRPNLLGDVNRDHESNQSSGYPLMHSNSCCSKHADQMSSSAILAKYLPAMSLGERLHQFLTDIHIHLKQEEEEIDEEDDDESDSN